MNATRFSHHLIAGAVSAALLAGCSAGSQFAPPTGYGGTSPVDRLAAVQQASPTHKSGVVSPDLLMMTYWIIVNGHVYWWYYNIHHVWVHGEIYGTDGGSNAGGSATSNKALDVAESNDTIAVYSGKKLAATLTGLNGMASGVATDSHGDTFAAVNLSGEAAVEEFAQGSTTPTATYADQNLASVSALAIDKANRIYVEGQSQKGGIEVDEMSGSGSFEALAQPGTLGATAGGLAVQISKKTTYLWINDLGNAGEPANIARYEFDGKSLVKQGSFDYSGTNGAIAVDQSGKDTAHVLATNNVASGSSYSVSGIEYAFPAGNIVAQSPAQSASQESVGIWVK